VAASATPQQTCAPGGIRNREPFLLQAEPASCLLRNNNSNTTQERAAFSSLLPGLRNPTNGCQTALQLSRLRTITQGAKQEERLRCANTRKPNRCTTIKEWGTGLRSGLLVRPSAQRPAVSCCQMQLIAARRRPGNRSCVESARAV